MKDKRKDIIKCALGHFVSPCRMKMAPVEKAPDLKILQDILKSNSELLLPISEVVLPNEGIVVFFEDHWERALVARKSSWIGGQLTHHVLLVDRGIFIDVTSGRQVSKDFFNKISFAAFDFQLDGVGPIATCDDGSLDWDLSVAREVEKLLKSRFFDVCVNYEDKDGVFYGDIFYITDNNVYASLSKLLIKNKFACKTSEVSEYILEGPPIERNLSDDSDSSSIYYTAEGSDDETISVDSFEDDICPKRDEFNCKHAKLCGPEGEVSSVSTGLKEMSETSPCLIRAEEIVKDEDGKTKSDASNFYHSEHSGYLITPEQKETTKNIFTSSAAANSVQNGEHFDGERNYLAVTMKSPETSCNNRERIPNTPNESREKSLGRSEQQKIIRLTGRGRGSAILSASSVHEKTRKKPHQSSYDLKDCSKWNNDQSISKNFVEELEEPLIKSDRVVKERLELSRPFWIYEQCLEKNKVVPASQIYYTNLNDHILSVINRRSWSVLRPIQTFGIPAVLNGKNTCIVSAAGSGKTFGYVLPLMSRLIEVQEKNVIPVGFGPLLLIISTGAKQVEQIYDLCTKFGLPSGLMGRAKTRFVKAHGGLGKLENKKWGEIVEGCEVLVVTPNFLARALKNDITINLKRLRWVVLDHVDRLLMEPYEKEMNAIKDKCSVTNKSEDIQWVMACRKYTPEVELFVKSIKEPTLLFGDHMEAAIYARIELSLLSVLKEEKTAKLFEILEPLLDKEDIVVVCRLASESKKLGEAMISRGWKPLVTVDTMSRHLEMDELNNRWTERKSRSLIVCYDSKMSELSVADATVLVHFSLSAVYSPPFCLRFSTLLDNFPGHFLKNQEVPELKSIILLDEETQIQRPKIVEFMQRLGCEVPDDCKSSLQEIQEKKYILKKKLLLCDQLLSRGECPEQSSCSARHSFIKELDSPNPQFSGNITFSPIIGSVLDGSSFAAIIQTAEDACGNRHTFADSRREIADAMAKYFYDSDSRYPIDNLAVGSSCAFKSASGIFLRAQVEQFCSFDDDNNVTSVRLRLVDDGRVLFEKVKYLYALTPELEAYPPQAMIIYIAGIVPKDFDTRWSYESKEILKAALEKPLKKFEKWYGTVRVALRSALILDSVSLLLAIPKNAATVQYHMVDYLVEECCAVNNSAHLPRLMSLCAASGIVPPAVPDKRVKLTGPRWAHFADVLPNVQFSYAASTSLIFLKNLKFVKLLEDLEKSCFLHGSRESQSGSKFQFKVGDICLAKDVCDSTTVWNRVRVEKIGSSNVDCFCVDHGNTWIVPKENIVPITSSLITQLPFQAIECTLGGIVHPDPCPDVIIDSLYDFTFDACFLTVIEKLPEKATKTGGSKFAINLNNCQGKSFNKLIVDEKMVAAADGGVRFLSDFELYNSESSSEFDEDEKESSHDIVSRNTEIASEFNHDMAENSLENVLSIQNALLDVEYNLEEDVKSEVKKIEPNISTPKIQKQSKPENNDAEPKSASEKTKNENSNVEKEANSEMTDLVREESVFAKTYWEQDFYTIKLRLEILGTSEEKLYATERAFTFTCQNKDGELCRVGVKLFGYIEWSQARCLITPLCVYIAFPKIVPGMWPRLQLSRKINPLILLDSDADK